MLQEYWEETSLKSNLERGLAAAAGHTKVQQGGQRRGRDKEIPKENPRRTDRGISKFK